MEVGGADFEGAFDVHVGGLEEALGTVEEPEEPSDHGDDMGRLRVFAEVADGRSNVLEGYESCLLILFCGVSAEEGGPDGAVG